MYARMLSPNQSIRDLLFLDLVFICKVVANLIFLIVITNLELSKVGVFMASAPALSALIAIKLMKQKPSIANWLGIAATSSALAIIALN